MIPRMILCHDEWAGYHPASILEMATAQPSISRVQWAVLGLILVFAGFLRFDRLGEPSLWMDEIWSVEMAMGRGSVHDHLPANVIHSDQPVLTSVAGAAPWWDIVAHLGGVTHPPLYFVVLRWWIDCFGTSELAIRSLSAVFSLGIVVVFFDVCRLLHGPRIGLLAAAISALAIGQLDFGQQSRSYPMLIFLGLCCADMLVRVEVLGVSRRRLIGLAICLVATALTHYLSAGLLVGLGVYAAIRLRGRARRLTLLAFVAAAVVVLGIWTPLFLDQKKTLPSLAPTFLREARTDEHPKMTLYRVIGLPIEFLVGEGRGESLSSALVLGFFLFTVALPVLRLYFRRDLLLWVLWCWCTIGLVAAMDLLHETTLVGYPRYTILASPAIYAVLAAFDWPRRAIIRDALAIAVIGLLAIVAIERNIDGVPPQEDWRTLADDLNASAPPGALIVYFNDDPWTSAGTWYMGFKYYEPGSRRPWLILNGPASATVLNELQSHQVLWLVGRFQQWQAARLLPGWVPIADQEQTTAGGFCPMVRADLAGRH